MKHRYLLPISRLQNLETLYVCLVTARATNPSRRQVLYDRRFHSSLRFCAGGQCLILRSRIFIPTIRLVQVYFRRAYEKKCTLLVCKVGVGARNRWWLGSGAYILFIAPTKRRIQSGHSHVMKHQLIHLDQRRMRTEDKITW